MINYPRPCDRCKSARRCERGSSYMKCGRWLTWFRWHWKQFNAYAKKYGIEPTTPPP